MLWMPETEAWSVSACPSLLGSVFQLVSLPFCLAPSMSQSVSQSVCLSAVTYRYVITLGRQNQCPLSDRTSPPVSPNTATEIQANHVGSLND